MSHNNQKQTLLRLKQILEIVPVSKSHWWKMVADGKAPKPIKLSPKCTVWRSEDIYRFIAEVSNEQK